MTHSHILLIEDDADVRFALREALEIEGYQVSEAEDAETALRILKSLRTAISLILLDNQMPGLGGRGFLDARRTEPDLLNIPVVGASATPWDVGPEMRVFGVLSKPFSLEELIGTVRRALSPPSP